MRVRRKRCQIIKIIVFVKIVVLVTKIVIINIIIVAVVAVMITCGCHRDAAGMSKRTADVGGQRRR